MNILLVNYMETTYAGGINKAVKETAKSLFAYGHQVTVLQPNPFNLPAEEVYEGFRIIRIYSETDSSLYGLNYKLYKYLKYSLNKLKPDLIHVHGYHTLFSIEAIILSKWINPKIKLVFSPHFGNPSGDNFASRYLWSLYNKCIGEKVVALSDSICAASHYEADGLNALKIPYTKITIIPHGVDIIDIDKQKRRTDTMDLLFVGYLLKGKGIQYIIEALYVLIYKLSVKARLTIIGEGDYEFKLKELASELNLNQFICWQGFMSSYMLVPEFKRADIFLLTSESENYGIVVAESLALGTPTIVTKNTALNEFLDEAGCFGIEYPVDPEKLAELILEIFSRNVKVGPLSNKIKEWGKVAKDYELLYQRALCQS